MDQQVRLSSGDSRMVAVVRRGERLRPGDRITLRDSENPGQRWHVDEVAVLPRSIPRGWANNI